MSAQLSFLRAELHELATAIAATEEAAQEAEDSFAWELSLNSLRTRRRELLAEIRAALEAGHVAELALRFDGAPVQHGTVEAGFLSEFLSCLQKLVFALGQAIAIRPTTRGTIPESVMERTRLRLATVSGGSFAVELVGDAHPDLFGQSLVQDCLAGLHELIEAGDSADSLASLLGGFGARVQTHYTSFLDSLTSANASVELQTWLDAATPRTTTVSPSRAKNITDALSLLQREGERIEKLPGRLIGLLQHRAQFEFQDPATEQVLSGKVLPVAVPRAALYFGRDVLAEFSVETLGIEGREEVKESWTLIGLNSLDD